MASVPANPAPGAPATPASRYGELLILPLRADLVTSEQVYLGRAYVVVKNPISLTYFRLSRAHYEAARRFDAKTPLKDIAVAMQSANAYWRALPLPQAIEEMAQLGNQLSNNGVLQTTGRYSLQRINAVAARRKVFRFDALLGSILYIKKSLVDPNRLLARMDRYFSWMFTRGYVRAFSAGDDRDALHARVPRVGVGRTRREFLHAAKPCPDVGRVRFRQNDPRIWPRTDL